MLLGLTVSKRVFVVADTIFIVEKKKPKLYCIVTSVRTIV